MNLYVWKFLPSEYHHVILFTLAETLDKARQQMREELREELACDHALTLGPSAEDLRKGLAEDPVVYPTDTPMADWWEHDG